MDVTQIEDVLGEFLDKHAQELIANLADKLDPLKAGNPKSLLPLCQAFTKDVNTLYTEIGGLLPQVQGYVQYNRKPPKKTLYKAMLRRQVIEGMLKEVGEGGRDGMKRKGVEEEESSSNKRRKIE